MMMQNMCDNCGNIRCAKAIAFPNICWCGTWHPVGTLFIDDSEVQLCSKRR